MNRYTQTIASLAIMSASVAHAGADDGKVRNDVKFAAEALKKDPAGTLSKVNGGEHPFLNKNDKGDYVFVYDMDMMLLAHPQRPELVGKKLLLLADPCGCRFRREILNRIQKNGKTEPNCRHDTDPDWVSYFYRNPEGGKIEYKKTYCEKVEASDSKSYIVCGGNFIREVKDCKDTAK